MLKALVYKIWMISAIFVVGIHASNSPDLSSHQQLRIIQMILGHSRIEKSRIHLAIVGEQLSQVKFLNEARLETITGIPQFRLSMVSPEIFLQTKHKYDAYLLRSKMSETENLKSGYCFTTSKDQVKAGCMVGILVDKTVPRLHMNLETLKKIQPGFSSRLLKLITFE